VYRHAAADLLPIVYDELRKLAAERMCYPCPQAVTGTTILCGSRTISARG